MRRSQQGLTLPTVMVLSLMGSVMLWAEWRRITLAQALAHSASQRWTLQQATQAALLQAVQDIQGPLTDSRHQPGTSPASQAFFPDDMPNWTVLQTRLGASDCMSGICKPLGEDSNSFAPWLNRLAQAQTQALSASANTYYWVEVLPLQSTLATTASPFVYRITALGMDRSPRAVFASQALWHPTPAHPESLATPLALAGFKRLLSLSP